MRGQQRGFNQQGKKGREERKGRKGALGRDIVSLSFPRGDCGDVFKMNMARMDALSQRAGCALEEWEAESQPLKD